MSGKSVVLSWNVWSILNESKLQNFLQILDEINVSIACVVETWFDSESGPFSRRIKEAGYELHHAYREGKKGGGVAILYKKKMKVKKGGACSSQNSSFEYAYITVSMNSNKKLVIICIYRKQEVAFTIFHDELSKFIEKIVFKGDAIMVVGDFNVWVDVEDDMNGKDLLKIMNSYGLNQQVVYPTHRGGHTLDQIYVNEFQLNIEYSVRDDIYGVTTDHSPLLIELPSTETQQNSRKIQYRNLKNVNIEEFKEDLSKCFDEINNFEGESFETLCTQYHNRSKAVVDTHAPIVERTLKNSTPSWLDQEYKQNRALRRKYEREWKRNRTETTKCKYIDQKKICADLALQKQTNYFTKIVEDAGTCQKSLFKIANEMLDKNKERVLPPYTDAKKLANEFNRFYIDKVIKIRDSIEQTTEESIYYRPFQGERFMDFRLVTEDEVHKIIKEKGIKTCIEDPIPSRLLKESLDIAVPILTKLINKSMQEGNVDGIKWSIIAPLLKKAGLDNEVYKNFRPVNNLVFLSKLTERCVDIQLDEHMSINNIHEPTQFAYKKCHNTETMMLGVTDEVLRGFDQNQATVIIFLDLSAAFDTINIEKVLEILEVEMGVGGTVLKWFRSFLEGRTQQVKIGNAYSESLEVPCGAPQGSVLGPRIFGVNVRSQPVVFKINTFSSSSFADDSNGRKQFALTFQFSIINNDIIQCLRQIIDWSNAHYMKINPEKTEILLLCPPSLNREVIIKGVIFEEQCIRFSDEVKNVGVWLDKNLTMNKQVNQIVSHGYKILKDIGRIKKCLQQNHIERLVHAVISSRLDYCNSLYMNISRCNIYKLQKIQNAAARLVVGGRKRDSMSASLRNLHWLKVESRVVFKILLLVYKIIKGQCSSNLKLQYKTFNGRPDDFLLLETPTFKSQYGKRIFAYNGSRLWNALPLQVRSEEDIVKFKKVIKTMVFDEYSELMQKAFKYT